MAIEQERSAGSDCSCSSSRLVGLGGHGDGERGGEGEDEIERAWVSDGEGRKTISSGFGD